MPAVTVDVEDVRQAYNRGLEVFMRVPASRAGVLRLTEEVRGYLDVLMPEAMAVAPRMRGEKRDTAVHFLRHAREVLAELDAVAPLTEEDAPLDAPPPIKDRDRLFELSVLCRTALAVVVLPGPLGEPTGLEEIEEAVSRIVCGACWRPIAEGEPTERKRFMSEAGPSIHGYVHAVLCLPRRPLLLSVPVQPSPA